MSIHALIAAAYLEDLHGPTKLVLMAIADSADEQTREAAPGLAKLRAWSGLGRSRTLETVGGLSLPVTDVRPPYVEKVAPGRRGSRAVYRVFPQGIPVIPTPAEVAARYELSTTGDNPVEKGPGDWTLGLDLGSDSGAIGSGPDRTPSCSTSVYSARATKQRPAGSGFPGARAASNATDPRTAPGFYRVPCVTHPEHDHPCPACAARPPASPEAIALARAALRKDHP